MDLTSTPFVKYHEIEIEETDIYDDAWGFNSEFNDILSFLGPIDESPADRMADHLVFMITGNDRS